MDDTNAQRVLAGPILRYVTADRLIVWLAVTQPTDLTLALYRDDDGRHEYADHRVSSQAAGRWIALGEHAWIVLFDVVLADHGIAPLADGAPIGYDIELAGAGQSLAALEPGLCYAGEKRPRFVVRKRLDQLLHGSCRRPHTPSADGMARADRWAAAHRSDVSDWVPLMLLTGDQIYVDDVAGPLLRAIHALIEQLGLWPETLTDAEVADSDALFTSPNSYYRRQELLPETDANYRLRDWFFGGTRKPVVTTATPDNHLITLGEIAAMYLLCFSDAPWRGLTVTPPELADEYRQRYADEQVEIDRFAAELPAVRRVMANTPTLMIFDDHDITDDWNLSAAWEDAIYGHALSRRMVGNALVGYLLFQGLGNRPEAFDGDIRNKLDAYTQTRDETTQVALIDALLVCREWYFKLPTEPPVLVLDTRMRRWRRERHPTWPSGLMDWEALTRLQQSFDGCHSVVLVSAAPIFGVKLIENIQRVATWLGYPLAVDAENWMAHPGAGSSLLNILSDARTPQNLTVLSGDVHYSFCYDVALRFVRTPQRIWQITSSGVKNEFPATLIKWFDRANRWLYGAYSPLNLLTKRSQLRIRPRLSGAAPDRRRLFNNAGIGYVRFDDDGRPADIRQLGADDQDARFVRVDGERERSG